MEFCSFNKINLISKKFVNYKALNTINNPPIKNNKKTKGFKILARKYKNRKNEINTMA
jgi:hypothetical protein